MDRRTALFAGAGLLGAAGRAAPQPVPPPVTPPATPPRVVFLNPGEPVERGKGPHWHMAARFMAASAQTFGLQLEVLYAERDHLLMLRQAESVAQRSVLPDYLVIVNEKLAAPQMLRLFERTTVKVLLIHNDLTAEQRREIGNEREQMRHWIGTVTTDEARAEYRLMEELYRQLGDREPQVIGITGDRATPVSMERAQGVSDFVAHAKRGQILQLAFGDWGDVDAESKAKVLLSRYPQTNIIWAANDSMALGAMRAVKARGAPVLVGGTGAWPSALASIAEGGLAASVGSHFFIAAWAMVLLHDYHHGLDFAAHGGPSMKLDYMQVVNRDTAAHYDQAVYKRDGALDFSVYSKVRRPRAGRYEFTLAPLLRKT
ncbi:ABC transporter substrate-binding protein [Aquabacterium sp.]|uniref:ABC transporter substrate-binding protein n=1 Tax=Aquabacterium sp. TaxID=1872578 RepID=UPI002B87085B|nr:ABC transporter substrate-binding protein [Aquabacterium sp.]HSW06751.1 ABC transporter substrate-binding protein [Aquabacterium sp.]